MQYRTHANFNRRQQKKHKLSRPEATALDLLGTGPAPKLLELYTKVHFDAELKPVVRPSMRFRGWTCRIIVPTMRPLAQTRHRRGTDEALDRCIPIKTVSNAYHFA